MGKEDLEIEQDVRDLTQRIEAIEKWLESKGLEIHLECNRYTKWRSLYCDECGKKRI